MNDASIDQVKRCPQCGQAYAQSPFASFFCSNDGAPLSVMTQNTIQSGTEENVVDPYIGITLPGGIRIESCIGKGSTGRIYKAFQQGTDRFVAVKVLLREFLQFPELVERFLREAKIVSHFQHPNLVQIFLTGRFPKVEKTKVGDELYLVMEYLDGISLSRLFDTFNDHHSRESLPLPRALHIGYQLCDAIGEVHEKGIVHRDLKPDNVMLISKRNDTDFVKILDFSVARLCQNNEAKTKDGLIFGSAKYISPEGAQGLTVTAAADVYSIAVIFYEAMSGNPPFVSPYGTKILMDHIQTIPVELRKQPKSNDVPKPISDLIMKNLSKNPLERCENARIFGDELVRAMRVSGMRPEDILSPKMHSIQPIATSFESMEKTRSFDAPNIPKIMSDNSSIPSNIPSKKILPGKSTEPIDLESIQSSLKMNSDPAQKKREDRFVEAEQVELSSSDRINSHPFPKRSIKLKRIVFGIVVLVVAFVAVVVGGNRLGKNGFPSKNRKEPETTISEIRSNIEKEEWSKVEFAILEASQKWPNSSKKWSDLRVDATHRMLSKIMEYRYSNRIQEAISLATQLENWKPSFPWISQMVLDLQSISIQKETTLPSVTSNRINQTHSNPKRP